MTIICTVFRSLCLIVALSLVLALILPGFVLAGSFYILALIFDDRRPSYYRSTTRI